MCRTGGPRCPSSYRRRARNARTKLARISSTPPASTKPLYGGQTSTVTLVTTPSGQRAVHKTPKTGDDPTDARFLADGEELTALLAGAVGAPVAQVHRDSPNSVWVEYIDGTAAGADQPAESPEAIRLGLLDAMTGNQDRAHNLMIRDGHLVGYDHGGTWLYSKLGYQRPMLREPSAPMAHFVAPGPDSDEIVLTIGTWRTDPPVNTAQVAAIRTRTEALRPHFEHAGRGDWLDYSLNVLDQIGRHAIGGPDRHQSRPGHEPETTGPTVMPVPSACVPQALR